jgi:hypothetical protein
MRFAAALMVLLAACSNAATPPPPPRPSLQALLLEKKFQPSALYTGVDTPEDQRPLESAVNDAVKDINALPEPLEKQAVLGRLSKLIDDTDSFATEDRDQVYRYAARIWQAAGFKEQSRLFAVPDEKVLQQP